MWDQAGHGETLSRMVGKARIAGPGRNQLPTMGRPALAVREQPAETPSADEALIPRTSIRQP
eukprot:6235837-Alexandrium_andersonii.AAC.1